MKALKSELAKRVLRAAFYDKAIRDALHTGEPFKFEGKVYRRVFVPKAPT